MFVFGCLLVVDWGVVVVVVVFCIVCFCGVVRFVVVVWGFVCLLLVFGLFVCVFWLGDMVALVFLWLPFLFVGCVFVYWF